MRIVETNLQPNSQLKTRRVTNGIVIHHSDTTFDVGAATIDGWHKGQTWAMIGYHFVIRMDGAIERGRPEWAIGSHAGPDANSQTIGVCLAGNFEVNEPTQAQYQALGWLVAYLRGIYGDIPLTRHSDWMQTACPGRYFDFNQIGKGGDDVEQINVAINGQTVQGFRRDGVAYAPVRSLAEPLGGVVGWDEASKTAVVQGPKAVRIVSNATELAPGMIVSKDGEDRTFALVRDIAKALGGNVRWDAATQTVFVDRG
ncbi:N-acetylmuramoyl-L-alanine amidase [Heliophilum fasciatum]|uniref:Copper amine oxidase-like protein n=1 Tax=Heliophilum fasciatum TaxID=35700 RepID=A0A4R2RPY3_9FIRM|nr:N-acetylmuramoyl-L-alanine amidase [Heliophilum fasciatum]MCW2277716.1 hypothetical protein [Heliophilum fasciatum]TCP64789.1 copper amine oxidase-like protein [Heliophilum fasciatum]